VLEIVLDLMTGILEIRCRIGLVDIVFIDSCVESDVGPDVGSSVGTGVWHVDVVKAQEKIMELT